jgi:hypothetical protein
LLIVVDRLEGNFVGADFRIDEKAAEGERRQNTSY